MPQEPLGWDANGRPLFSLPKPPQPSQAAQRWDASGKPIETPTATPAATENAEPPFWQAIRAGLRAAQVVTTGTDNPFAADLVSGAAKGAARTVVGLGELASNLPGIKQTNEALDRAYGTPGASRVAFPAARADLAPRTSGEHVGMMGEQGAEFFLPSAQATKIKTALTTGRGLLDAMMRAGVEAASAGAVGTIQAGSPAGAGGPVIASVAGSAASPLVGKGLEWLGERIEKSLVKATARDVQNGFQVSNIYKHQLGGTLGETFDKSSQKLNTLGQQLKAELSKTGPGGVVPEVDVLQALTDAATELSANAGKTMGRNQAIDRAVQNYLDDPAFQSLVKNGRTDLVTANQIKQGVGELGAWASGARDLDANAAEIVANAFYSKLRAAIEKAAPSGPGRIGDLNRQMGEIIPIRQAIIRRIPVEQRSNVINLGDMIGLASGDIGIALANRLLRSGRVADLSVKTGNLLQTTPAGARLAAGLAGQVKK